jgi:hypothetical protein
MTLSPPARRAPDHSRGRARPAAVLWLFSLTLFVSAALVFLIQPMFAKFVLPLFGSTPAVWNASMVFFQMALLAAYLYAHVATRRLGVRRQAVLHTGVLALPLLVLPIAVPDGFVPSSSVSPVAQLLGLLAVTVGLPFFVAAASAPLLQRWLADIDHPASADPYFLYAASNLGSILGLLAYPLALERGLRLAEQGWLWSTGYGLLAALVLGCAVVVWRSRPGHETVAADRFAPTSPRADDTRPSPARRLRWIFLAFVPSSLMLGVTTYLTTDIAPIPLLWAIPLSLYLLSFSIVFAPGSRARALHRWMVLALPPLALTVAVLLLVEATDPLWLVMPVHLLAFFVAAMVCHGELARDRPAATSLTGFYLSIALGGALGGVFNAVVAPAVFDSLLEYPLAVVLACLCLPRRAPRFGPGRLARGLDVALPVMIGAVAALLLMLVSHVGDVVSLGDGETLELEKAIALSLAAVVALTFVRRPLRFGLAAAAIVVAGLLPIGHQETELYQARSFFGVYRVTASPGGYTHSLTHGTTLHGTQSFQPGLTLTPLTYYQHEGPIGQLMGTLRPAMSRRAAVIGLGTGSMACYARRGDRWTFYEIDPLVEHIARDPRLFTFLRDCPGRYDVVLGDARLSLSRAAGRRYGLIVLDAFTSDAIPIHLLTREALALYRSRLRGGGVLALHISNRYLDLEPVVARLAHDAGLACRAQQGLESDWAAMAEHKRDLGSPSIDARWHDCWRGGGTVWTDDFSNLFESFEW